MTDHAVTDPASGLFSEAMVRAVLPSRVATARRTLRQLGLVLVLVEDGPPPAELAEAVFRSIRDSDMAGRLDDGALALVLEYTPGEGCRVVAERLRARVLERAPGAVLRAGVACYPAHALTTDELLDAARGAATTASPGETVVAPVPD